MPQRHHAAEHRPRHPFMLFRQAFERLAVSREFTRRPTAGDRPCVRAAHHNAFEHGLAADQRFLAAFERGQMLNRYQKTPQRLKKLHKDWMTVEPIMVLCRLTQRTRHSSGCKWLDAYNLG